MHILCNFCQHNAADCFKQRFLLLSLSIALSINFRCWMKNCGTRCTFQWWYNSNCSCVLLNMERHDEIIIIIIIIVIIIIIIIIESFYSLWNTGHPWRASKHCDLQLSPWPHSMIFLCFLFHPLLSFATFSSAYLFFYTPEGVFSIAPSSSRTVCPIQFHFLLFIWISIGFCLVILHSSSFVILSVHFIFIIRLKHTWWNGDNKTE